MKTKQSKLLWIPRSLLILVGMFYLYMVHLCLIAHHGDLLYFSLVPLLLAVIFIVSFFRSILSGGFLILSTIYLLFSVKGFNSFIYYPIVILLLSGMMMIIISIYLRKKSSVKAVEPIHQKPHQPRKTIGFLLLGIFSPIIFLILFITIKYTIAAPGVAVSGSMSPTIQTNALLLVNEAAYRYQDPRRGDMIEFTPIHKPEANYIKRVIGIPGDTIEWRDYNIYINGKKLVEPYEFDTFTKTYKQTNEFPTVTLKADEYFVMGDNRMFSYDGRYFDPVKRDAITGKVYFIHNPPED